MSLNLRVVGGVSEVGADGLISSIENQGQCTRRRNVLKGGVPDLSNVATLLKTQDGIIERVG